MFLITTDKNVVAQFPLNLEFLRNPQAFKSYINDLPIPTYTPKKIVQKLKTVDELKAGMKRVDVKATIIAVPPSQLVYSKWGDPCYVSNVELADETGSIRLCLWNDHIQKVQVGDDVEIKSGYIYSFKGEPQLRLKRNSTLSIIN